MSMAGYTKLFNSILASTIWRAQDKTRLVWITMLAMADKDGVVEGSIPGLADFARVGIQDCEAALAELSGPDKYSRSGEHEGRRIEEIPGVGWHLLNHGKYREKMSEDERREYNRTKQAEFRERKKMSTGVNDSQLQSAMSAHTEADTDTEALKDKRIVTLPDWIPTELWDEWMQQRTNLSTGKKKKLVNSVRAMNGLINRLDEIRQAGYTVEYAIETALEKNWVGIQKDWLDNLKANGNKPAGT